MAHATVSTKEIPNHSVCSTYTSRDSRMFQVSSAAESVLKTSAGTFSPTRTRTSNLQDSLRVCSVPFSSFVTLFSRGSVQSCCRVWVLDRPLRSCCVLWLLFMGVAVRWYCRVVGLVVPHATRIMQVQHVQGETAERAPPQMHESVCRLSRWADLSNVFLVEAVSGFSEQLSS